MYEEHFGLDRKPFSAAPDESFFVATDTHERARDAVRLAIQAGQRIGIITASAGLGKSILCRTLSLDLAETHRAVLLTSANFPDPSALLKSVLFELGVDYEHRDLQELRLLLTRELRDSGRPAVLIVDEAHLLETAVLDEVRAITDLTSQGTPLVQAVLAGQLALDETLAAPALAAFNERVGCHAVIEPLTRDESRRIVDERLQIAGGTNGSLFAPEVIEFAVRASDGSPRCLNQLLDHSMLLAYTHGADHVSPADARDALDDLKQLPLRWVDPGPIGEIAPPGGSPSRTEPDELADSADTMATIEEIRSDLASMTSVPSGESAVVETLEDTSFSADQPEVTGTIEVGAPDRSDPGVVDDVSESAEEPPSDDTDAVSAESAVIEVGAVDGDDAASVKSIERTDTGVTLPETNVISADIIQPETVYEDITESQPVEFAGDAECEDDLSIDPEYDERPVTVSGNGDRPIVPEDGDRPQISGPDEVFDRYAWLDAGRSIPEGLEEPFEVGACDIDDDEYDMIVEPSAADQQSCNTVSIDTVSPPSHAPAPDQTIDGIMPLFDQMESPLAGPAVFDTASSDDMAPPLSDEPIAANRYDSGFEQSLTGPTDLSSADVASGVAGLDQQNMTGETLPAAGHGAELETALLESCQDARREISELLADLTDPASRVAGSPDNDNFDIIEPEAPRDSSPQVDPTVDEPAGDQRCYRDLFSRLRRKRNGD